MTILLTDDEVVAVAVQNDAPWPTPLPSVTLTSESLVRSRQMGLRSLVVRGLLEVGVDGPRFDPAVVETVLSAAKADRWVAAYVAAGETPTELAGDSTYVYSTASGPLVDAVTPTGIHELISASVDEAQGLIEATAKNVFSFGIANGNDGASLFVGNSTSAEWVRVRRGDVSIGSFSDSEFVTSTSTAEWTGEEIVAVTAGVA